MYTWYIKKTLVNTRRSMHFLLLLPAVYRRRHKQCPFSVYVLTVSIPRKMMAKSTNDRLWHITSHTDGRRWTEIEYQRVRTALNEFLLRKQFLVEKRYHIMKLKYPQRQNSCKHSWATIRAVTINSAT